MVQPLFRGFRTVNAVNAGGGDGAGGTGDPAAAEQSVLLEAVTLSATWCAMRRSCACARTT